MAYNKAQATIGYGIRELYGNHEIVGLTAVTPELFYGFRENGAQTRGTVKTLLGRWATQPEAEAALTRVKQAIADTAPLFREARKLQDKAFRERAVALETALGNQ